MDVTKEQLVEKLDQLEKAYNEWKEVVDKVEGVFGVDFIDGDLGRSVDGFISLSVDLFSELSGISTEVLWWWIYDAKWGKGKHNRCNRDVGEPFVSLNSNKEFIEWELADANC